MLERKRGKWENARNKAFSTMDPHHPPGVRAKQPLLAQYLLTHHRLQNLPWKLHL